MKLFDLPDKELSMETYAVSLDSLDPTLSFKDFMDKYTFHIVMKHKSLLNKFYLNMQPSEMPYVDTYPEYSESSGNYRYRFMIISINEDYVLVNLKVVDLMNGTRYFHIYPPRSLQGVKDNETATLKGLAKYEHFRQVITITSEPQDEYWCNNYYNTLSSACFMFRSKYTSKHCISRIEKLVDTSFINTCDVDLIREIEEFSKLWKDLKPNQSANIKSDIKLINAMMHGYNDIQMFTCRLNGKLLAFSILFINQNNYAIVHTAEYLSIGGIEFLQNYCNCSYEEAKMLTYNLSNYVQYRTHMEYLITRGFKALYYEGDTHVAKLKSYKPMFFKNLIYYLKTPIQDYIKSLEDKI